MQSRDEKDLTDLEDWLEHIDTVVLGGEQDADSDSTAEEEEQAPSS